MNSARQIQRLAPGGPLRASGLRSSRCTPPSQYRSLSSRTTQLSIFESATCSTSTTLQQQPLLRSTLPVSAVRLDTLSQLNARSFHVSARTRQKEAEKKDAKAPSETPAGEEAKEPESKEEAKEEAKEEKEGEEKEGEEKAEGKEKEKKEDLPPPPPHGDKTPWQVFLDTMNTELKQSKEWNESTKALASSATDFVESESVRKARQAYEATHGAVTSTAAKAVKSTAGAIGKGATWTWETPVMKGVRKGANKTGEALDKATKPIRETEAYKNVKDVIDDGSSSRYGGWVDKEERKRRRELRQKQSGVDTTIYDEDPK
jgi:import inner membrane translocase subunit TIM44